MQTHVREALSRPRITHALRPSHGSSNRIIGDLRNAKWSTRREERYRILSSHRAGLPTEPWQEQKPEENAKTDTEPHLGDVQVFDIVQEDVEEDEKDPERVRAKLWSGQRSRTLEITHTIIFLSPLEREV